MASGVRPTTTHWRLDEHAVWDLQEATTDLATCFAADKDVLRRRWTRRRAPARLDIRLKRRGNGRRRRCSGAWRRRWRRSCRRPSQFSPSAAANKEMLRPRWMACLLPLGMGRLPRPRQSRQDVRWNACESMAHYGCRYAPANLK